MKTLLRILPMAISSVDDLISGCSSYGFKAMGLRARASAVASVSRVLGARKKADDEEEEGEKEEEEESEEEDADDIDEDPDEFEDEDLDEFDDDEFEDEF